MNLLDFLPIINIIGFLVLGSSMIFIQWKTGSNSGVKVASEVIDTYKTQVQQLRDELASERLSRQGLALSLERMKGQNDEKDKKILDLTAIFQGKSPEQEQYMRDMREFTKGVAQYMKDSAEIFAGMKEFMTNINKASMVNAERNTRIDKKIVKGGEKI